MRRQVERLDSAQAISRFDEPLAVARERRRVAADVDNALEIQFTEPPNDVFTQAASWRIDKRDIVLRPVINHIGEHGLYRALNDIDIIEISQVGVGIAPRLAGNSRPR